MIVEDEVGPAYARLTFPRYRGLFGTPGVYGVGLRQGDRPVALALAGGPELLSLFVEPDCRRQGLAGRLLAAIEAAARARGHGQLHGSYATRRDTTAQLEHLLARHGWQAPVTEMLAFRSGPAQVADAPWMKPLKLGPRDRIVDLVDVSLEALVSEPWIPADLRPWAQEPGWDPRTSVALLRDDAVVGWLVTHRLDPRTLRYTCSYVRPDLQKRGRVLLLYQEVVARSRVLDLPVAIWTVPVRHEGMRAFGERWMAPYADATWEHRSTSKPLD